MRGQQESNTRRLNHHYQSGNGGMLDFIKVGEGDRNNVAFTVRLTTFPQKIWLRQADINSVSTTDIQGTPGEVTAVLSGIFTAVGETGIMQGTNSIYGNFGNIANGSGKNFFINTVQYIKDKIRLSTQSVTLKEGSLYDFITTNTFYRNDIAVITITLGESFITAVKNAGYKYGVCHISVEGTYTQTGTAIIPQVTAYRKEVIT